MTPNDIEKIFVVNGPGSFTGIRIGVTIAKTYAYALNKEIVPVSSLKMAILEFTGFDYYVSIIPDKRNYSYLGIYDKEYNTIFEGLVEQEMLENKMNELEGNIKTIKKELDSTENKNLDSVNPNYLKEVI